MKLRIETSLTSFLIADCRAAVSESVDLGDYSLCVPEHRSWNDLYVIATCNMSDSYM